MSLISRTGWVAAVCLAALSGVARADDAAAMFHATTLNISAVGEIKTTPDQATITLGVNTTGHTAAEAMRANRERMNAVISQIAAQGIEKKDVQTTNLNLSAQYAYEQNQSPRLTGYQADNAVTVTVRDVTRLGAVVDAVTAGGANQVNGISFGLSDPRPAMDQARRDAVKALRARADLYAQAEGMRVVRLINLSESGGVTQGPPRPMVFAAARAVAPTPVEPGELSVDVSLSAVYELGN